VRVVCLPLHPTPGIIIHRGRHWSQLGPVTPGRHWHWPVKGSQVTAPDDKQVQPETKTTSS